MGSNLSRINTPFALSGSLRAAYKYTYNIQRVNVESNYHTSTLQIKVMCATH